MPDKSITQKDNYKTEYKYEDEVLKSIAYQLDFEEGIRIWNYLDKM